MEVIEIGNKVDCPCGSLYSTPHGEDDAVAFVQWHVRQVHPDDYPKGISAEDARAMVLQD